MFSKPPWLLGSKILKFPRMYNDFQEFHWVEVRRGLRYQVEGGGTNGPRKSMMIQRGNAYMGIHKLLLLVELVVSTHLKNMRKSNWIVSPSFIGEHEQKYLSCHHPAEYVYRSKTCTRTISPLWVYLTSAV